MFNDSYFRPSLSLRSAWREWRAMWAAWPPRPVWTPASPTWPPWWCPASTASTWSSSHRPRTAARSSAAASSRNIFGKYFYEIFFEKNLTSTYFNIPTSKTTIKTLHNQFSDLQQQPTQPWSRERTDAELNYKEGGDAMKLMYVSKEILKECFFWNMQLLKISQLYVIFTQLYYLLNTCISITQYVCLI